MNKIERQREHFDNIAEEYYSARKNENHLRYKQLLFQYFLGDRMFAPGEMIRVLEPMCGYAEGKQIVERYIASDFEYTGFDYSEVLLGEIRADQPELNVFLCDVTKYEPPKESFDLIILIGGLHHVPDYAESVCEKLCGGLKKGGYFINFEPTNNNPLVALARCVVYKRNSLFDEETERAFSLRGYDRMFLRAGMSKDRQFFPGLLGYVLYYNPDAFPGLNLGTVKTVEGIFRFERRLYRSLIGRLFSFCTFTVWKK